MAFTNLKHLWRQRDIWLSIEGGVHIALVRLMWLFVSETWPLRTEHTQIPLFIEHRFFVPFVH